MIYETPRIEIITVSLHEDVVCDMSYQALGNGEQAEFIDLFDEFK